MPEVLYDILSKLRSVEPFPTVATTALQWSERPDVIPADLVEVVQADPGLTAKVLKLSNSAYYGFQQQISSLREAGNRLGTKVLTNLIVTTCGTRYFREFGGDEESSSELWMRCVTNALSSRLIAGAHGNCDPEVAYTAALLQDIGSIVIQRFLTELSEPLQEEARVCGSLLDAEKRVLGLTHAEIGARLSSSWGLPSKLVDTIRYHHRPELAREDPVLAGTAHLAETLSWAVGAGAGLEGLTFNVSGAALAITGLDREDLRELDNLLVSELANAQDFMEA